MTMALHKTMDVYKRKLSTHLSATRYFVAHRVYMRLAAWRLERKHIAQLLGRRNVAYCSPKGVGQG